jgi:hypothetical protein
MALTKLYEGLVDSPLQSVIEVIAYSRGEPSRHAQVVHVDLTTSMLELMVRAAMVRRSPRVAEMVQHVLEQGWETGMVQPVAMKSSIGSEGGIGVVIHLLKTRHVITSSFKIKILSFTPR